jgi:hypothetical protein
MNCLIARQTLDLFRPHDAGRLGDTPVDESQGAAIDESLRHVDGCPACKVALCRRDQIDERIGQLMRDVPVSGGLRERLLAAISHEGGVEKIASESQVTTVMTAARPVLRSRRGLIVALASACIVMAASVSLTLLRTPTLSLNEIAEVALSDDVTADLPALTQFKGGLDLQLPKTMRALPLMQPVRRVIDARLGEREIGIYFFAVSRSPRLGGGTYKGRLVIVPAASVKDVPAASSFPGATEYKRDFCTTAWVEGKFVYLCCVRNGGEPELHLLRPAVGEPT